MGSQASSGSSLVILIALRIGLPRGVMKLGVREVVVTIFWLEPSTLVAAFGCSIDNNNGFLEREGELYCVIMAGGAETADISPPSAGGAVGPFSTTSAMVSMSHDDLVLEVLVCLYKKSMNGEQSKATLMNV